MRSAVEDTAVVAVFMVAVAAVFMAVAAVVFMAAAVVFMAAVATAVEVVFEEVVLTAEAADSVAAATAAGDLTEDVPIEAGRPWVAGALDLVGPVDLGAASMLQVADTGAATDSVLAMRSRTAAGIHSEALEAPRMQEVPRDFAIPLLPMADGTRLEARTRV